ncbi:MAG: DUF6263 family protein [Prevotellaceae bacterium]|jgi:hypothetical protein|nr:DUF6263 family protein [Prevotellaceae bacterium]
MKKLSFFTIATLFAMGCMAQKPVELRMSLQKGQVFKQEMQMNMKIKVETQGMKIDTEMPFEALISYKVTNNKNKNFILKVSYDAMKMKFNLTGMDFSFDSSEAKPNADNPVADVLSGLIGKHFLMTVNELGNVVKIEGLDKILNAALDKKQFTKEQRKQMQVALAGIFSEDKIRDNFSSSSLVFPKAPVTKGYSWKSDEEQELQGIKMNVSNTYIIENITPENVLVSCESTFKMNGDISKGEKNTKVYVNDSKSTSSYIVDLKTGWTKDTKSMMSLVMKIVIQQNDTEMTVPMEMSVDIYVKSY